MAPRAEDLIGILSYFAHSLKFKDLSEDAVYEAKRRLLDSLGCFIGGLSEPAVMLVRQGMMKRSLNGWPGVQVPGLKGRYMLEDAAFMNTHAIRALDYNDTYLSKEPAHPSDNIGALLALCNFCGYEGKTGGDLITALVAAYDIQCRFCDAASPRAKGFDHVNYLTISSALAAGKMLGLSLEQMKQAASLSLRWAALRQIREGSQLSPTKALSAAEAVHFGIRSALQASWGIVGASEMIEGRFGLMNQITGYLDMEAFSNLREEYKILRTHIKCYPVEYHAQTAVEAALDLREALGITGKLNVNAVGKIGITSSEATRAIIGGKSKRTPATKESADHSIYYILAVTLIDGEMRLEQYRPERLRDPAISLLISRMEDVRESAEYTANYYNAARPEFTVCISLKVNDNGGSRVAVAERTIAKGHFIRPMRDYELVEKFNYLCARSVKKKMREKIIDAVWRLEKMRVEDFAKILQEAVP